jgi:hypothetical protein
VGLRVGKSGNKETAKTPVPEVHEAGAGTEEAGESPAAEPQEKETSDAPEGEDAPVVEAGGGDAAAAPAKKEKEKKEAVVPAAPAPKATAKDQKRMDREKIRIEERKARARFQISEAKRLLVEGDKAGAAEACRQAKAIDPSVASEADGILAKMEKPSEE